MLKNKKKYLMLLLAAMIMIPMSVYAQPPDQDGDHSKEHGMHGKMEPGQHPMIPDLTDKQKEKMKDLHVEHMKTVQPIKNEIGELEAKFHTLQSADKPNMGEINKLIEAIGQKRIDIMKLKAAHMQEIRKLLTDEQRVFFDAHKPHQGGKMKHHGTQMQKKQH
ncbi:MAG: Spy/CpxP family protein refolding chaperone [bacterium]